MDRTISKRRLVVWIERRLQNPVIRLLLRAGVPLPPFALIETSGRVTGQARQTPVLDGRHGHDFWIVAEHGRNAHYVLNLEADPRVRVLSRGRGHTGSATIVDDDDPYARARWMADTLGPLHRADALVTRITATTPLTIRVSLDDDSHAESSGHER